MSGWPLFTMIEGVLVFGVVSLWGWHELRTLAREKRKREEREAAQKARGDGA